MYSSTLPSTSALDGVGGQRHAPAALLLGKARYPSYRRLGGTQGRSGRVQKISPPPTGIRSPDRQARSESLCRLRYPGPKDIPTGIYLFIYLFIPLSMNIYTFRCKNSDVFDFGVAEQN